MWSGWLRRWTRLRHPGLRAVVFRLVRREAGPPERAEGPSGWLIR